MEVPGLERRPAHRLPAAHDEHSRQKQQGSDKQIFQEPECE
jgi:hypothetical protein